MQTLTANSLREDSVTPVMAQYLEAKATQPDALLFFRMGDFYELFFEDAVTCAGALDLALTRRGKHLGEDIPMCGVPAHTAETYISRLIRKGFCVAVCDQLEDPREAKKRGSKSVVKRGVVRVVTPGTLTEDGLLEARGANYLMAVAVQSDGLAAASVDLSTGEVETVRLDRSGLAGHLAALRPSETLVAEAVLRDSELKGLFERLGGLIHAQGASLTAHDACLGRALRLYGVATLEAFGDFNRAEVTALGMVAGYLDLTQAGVRPLLKPPRQPAMQGFLSLDPATRASLEIDRTQRGGTEGSLIETLDLTVTAPGARLLRARLGRPLCDKAEIEARLDGVAWWLAHEACRRDTKAGLKGLADMARALSRLGLGRGGPRDLSVVIGGLRAAEAFEGLIEAAFRSATALDQAAGEVGTVASGLALTPALKELLEVLERALVDQPPLLARDGGFIRADYNARLNETLNLKTDAARIIIGLEQRLQAETGVSLKIRYNAILGYFIETTQKQSEPLSSPPHQAQFIHRQSLANQVRFTTTELMELDRRISGAEAEALTLELMIFEDLRSRILEQAPALQAICECLAILDVSAAAAEWAAEVGAVRPDLSDGGEFVVEAGRHPVVDSALKRKGQPFTPNGARLDAAGRAGPRLVIVTGPNMAGKSTFLRQNALLILMAQSGWFVPARSMRLGLVDRLFSRVGAGDDLAQGRSTFMMEMIESAAIMSQATAKSFVIMDEIGRGTATFDGLAIAWACAEALHEHNSCRALFATHYHEMARLPDILAHACNLSLTAREHGGDLIFLHEVKDGAADRSFGVQVARLAGMPSQVVDRARTLLERFETEHAKRLKLDDLPLFAHAQPSEPSWVEAELAQIDVDELTPRAALEFIYRLKSAVRSK